MTEGTVHPERPGQLSRFIAGIAEHDRAEGNPAKPSKAARTRVHVNAAFVRRAYRKKAVVAWSGIHIPAPIFHALDIVLFPPESMSAMLAPYRMAQIALERAEEGFYSRDICSFVRGALGAAEEAFYPTPDFFIGTTCFCDSAMKMLYNLSRKYGKNHFYIDIPAVYDTREDAVAYVADQLKALVAALEKRFGRRMDLDRLREAIRRSNLTREYALKCRELRRGIPAVILGREAMDYLSAEGWGSEGMVVMYKALYEELRDRTRRNVAAVENERCRILWTSMRPYYSDDIFDYLEKKLGAVVVLDLVNFVVEKMDPSTPYESLARSLLDSAQYPRTGILKQLEADISSHHIDGVVLYAHWRCEKANNFAYAFAQIAERKGVPFLALDGDCVDGRDYAQEQIRTRIDAFMEVIEHRRREREQREGKGAGERFLPTPQPLCRSAEKRERGVLQARWLTRWLKKLRIGT